MELNDFLLLDIANLDMFSFLISGSVEFQILAAW